MSVFNRLQSLIFFSSKGFNSVTFYVQQFISFVTNTSIYFLNIFSSFVCMSLLFQHIFQIQKRFLKMSWYFGLLMSERGLSSTIPVLGSPHSTATSHSLQVVGPRGKYKDTFRTHSHMVSSLCFCSVRRSFVAKSVLH